MKPTPTGLTETGATVLLQLERGRIELLVDRYAGLVERMARNYLRMKNQPPALVEAVIDDITQEVFYRVAKPSTVYKRELGRLKSWLWAIVQHVGSEQLRAHYRSPGQSFDDEPIDYPHLPQDIDEDLSEATIATAIANLRLRRNPITIESFVLTQFRDLTDAEASRCLKIKPNTVAKHRERIRRDLIEMLGLERLPEAESSAFDKKLEK